MEKEYEQSGAGLSHCRLYRYWLGRVWAEALPTVGFVMLNPSTADAHEDDPTIRRCVGFAQSWGYGGMSVVNLFALRSTNPESLAQHSDPVGPDNSSHWSVAHRATRLLVAAWGTHGRLMRQDEAFKEWAARAGVVLRCLGVNADGSPLHPLYVKADTQPKVY